MRGVRTPRFLAKGHRALAETNSYGTMQLKPHAKGAKTAERKAGLIGLIATSHHWMGRCLLGTPAYAFASFANFV